MQSFVDWFTASRLSVILGAALLATLGYAVFVVMWLPGALVVLLALRGGRPLADWQTALVAGVTFSWWLLAAGAGPLPAVLVAVGLIVPPLIVGRVLARGGSLSVVFQLSTLAALGVLAIVHLVLANPPGVWQPFVEKMAAELDTVATMMANVDSQWHPTNAELREAAADYVNWGVAISLLLVNTIVAAAIGLYAHGRQRQSAELGPQFRAIKAGRTLATVAAVLIVASVALKWDFARDAQHIFMGAFFLQGLALLHAAREILGLGNGWMAASYGLLLVPLTAIVAYPLLAVAGFLDNWLPLRARLALIAAKNKVRGG